jgi:hypothetical protein
MLTASTQQDGFQVNSRWPTTWIPDGLTDGWIEQMDGLEGESNSVRAAHCLKLIIDLPDHRDPSEKTAMRRRARTILSGLDGWTATGRTTSLNHTVWRYDYFCPDSVRGSCKFHSLTSVADYLRDVYSDAPTVEAAVDLHLSELIDRVVTMEKERIRSEVTACLTGMLAEIVGRSRRHQWKHHPGKFEPPVS